MRHSFRLRLILCSAILLIIFLALLLPIIREAFDRAVQQFSNIRLEEDANALITAAKVVDGELKMPETLQDLRLDATRRTRVGYVYTPETDMTWASHRKNKHISGMGQDKLSTDKRDSDFRLSTDALGRRYFVYDKEVNLGGPDLSVMTMEPVNEYDVLRTGFLRRFELWLILSLACLLFLLSIGLNWSLRPLRRLGHQLDDIEAGKRDQLDENVPSEIRRLTRSLNRMLTTERMQRERYQDTLGDLAHSLKTPLAVLQNTVESIKENYIDGQQIEVIQKQLARMKQQVGYQLQRATQRKGALIAQRISLRPLIDSLETALNKVYADKQVIADIELSYSVKVHAEEAALLEVFGNLLENAYRLCVSRVKVVGYETEEDIRIDIQDDGPGIAVDKREAVLQRGVREDSLNAGQGIGLAVVQDILEGYQGYLEINDSPLGGACFSVYLSK